MLANEQNHRTSDRLTDGKTHMSRDQKQHPSAVSFIAARSMLCLCRRAVSVCPSIRLYVTSCILSKRINISSNFFSPSGSHTILCFSIPTVMASYFRGSVRVRTPHPVGQIGSAVRVSASFQIFALRNCYISMRGLPLGDFCNSLGISPALSSHRITVEECMNDSTSLKCIN